VTLHENGVLCGRWLRIWTGAFKFRDLFGAEYCLDLFHNIILFTRQQSLTAESLNLRKSRRVQPLADMRTDKSSFLLCPDKTSHGVTQGLRPAGLRVAGPNLHWRRRGPAAGQLENPAWLQVALPGRAASEASLELNSCSSSGPGGPRLGLPCHVCST
jgi:hypothetical protein